MQKLEEPLRTLLAHNIVSFTFKKVNGEIRHALGTRNLSIASNYTGSDIPTPVYEEQPNSYYDVEKDGWRSYKPENLISIDGVYARTDTDFAKKPTLPNEPPKETKKPELPKREIPISKPMGGGADIDKFGFGGLFGVGVPKEEIRKSMDKLGKDIVIGAPAHSPKIGTPTFTDKGVELEMGIGVEDFAKMVARYVVDEIANRLK